MTEFTATVEPKVEATKQGDAYPHGHAEPSGHGADRIAKLVTELGAGWARYGLTLGRLALQQTAKTLESTAELLGAVATKVDQVTKAEKPGDKAVDNRGDEKADKKADKKGDN